MFFSRKTIFILFLSMLTYAIFAASDLSPCALADNAADEALNNRAKQALRAAKISLDLQMVIPDKPEIEPENRRLGLPDVSMNTAMTIMDVSRILLICAIVAIIVVVLLNFKDNLWSSSSSRRLRRNKEEEAETIAVTGRMDKAQYAADELAAGGNYAEAMHVLLLQSVNELRLRLDISIASSLTSREILHHINLSPQGKAMFSDIVRRVEISYFGFHEPGEADYMACRESFESLARSLMELIQREGTAFPVNTGGSDGGKTVGAWGART